MSIINPSRREVIAALSTIPAIASSSMAIAAANPDFEIVSAWNTRQRSLAVMESRGSFFKAEHHSPVETAAFDAAEMGIYNLPAKTPRGVLAKLWVALSHSGGQLTDEEGRAEHDAMRRADLAEVESFASSFDFNMAVLFSAIRSLEAMEAQS